MLKHVREFYEYGKPLGFGEPEIQGNDHFRMRHANGGIVTFGCTPSDWRAKANTIADMHRIAEIPAEKPNAGKYTVKKEHSRLYTDRSENEERAIDRASHLQAEWSDTIARLQKISDYYDEHGRNGADDALGWVLWEKLTIVKGELEDLHRTPLASLPWPQVNTREEYVELWLGRWAQKPHVAAPEPDTSIEHGGLTWESPPEPKKRGVGRPSIWQPIVEQLKARPGEWAKVGENVATATPSRLKKKYPGLETRGETDPDRRSHYRRLWMRWVGDMKE